MKPNTTNTIIIVFILFIIFLCGCNASIPTTPSSSEGTYTITVISDNPTVWGYIWVDGSSSGEYLSSNSSVIINEVNEGAAITLVDEYDCVSHTEFFNPPDTTIIFNYW